MSASRRRPPSPAPPDAPAPAPAPRRLLDCALALGLFLVAAAVFSPTWQHDFVKWDDDINITANPNITRLDAASFRWMWTDFEYMRRYVPLTWLAFTLNHTCFGVTPASYHVGNILLHALASVLVFLILRQLLGAWVRTSPAFPPPPPEEKAPAGRMSKGGPGHLPSSALSLCAALGALLWALHPLRVEVVAWASGRICCQALTFLFGSLLAYLHAADAPNPARRRWALACSVLCYAGSMLTYPLGLAYPFLLLVLDVFPLRRFAGGWWQTAQARQTWLEKAPFFAVMAAVFGVTLWAQTHASDFWGQGTTLADFGILPRLMQAFYIWGYFLWKPWWPADLAPAYSTLVAFQPGAPFLVASALLVLGLTALLLWQRRAWPLPAALWAAHLLFMVPMLGLLEHPHYASDRYSYFQGFLWSAALAALLLRLAPRPPLFRAGLILGLLLAAACALLSLRQGHVWKDSVTLFEHQITQLADSSFRSDIRVRLGLEFIARGQEEPGLNQLREAVRLTSNVPESHEFLASFLAERGRLEEALTHHAESVRLGPTAKRRVQYARTLLAAGRPDDAIAQLRQALAQDPNDPVALDQFAWLLATHPYPAVRHGAEAVALAERLVQTPGAGTANAYVTLAAAYAEAGRFDDALQAAGQAQRLAETAGDAEFARKTRLLIQQFRQQRPHRELPAGTPPGETDHPGNGSSPQRR